MKKVLIIILVIIVLLAIPTTFVITSGVLSTEEEKAYRIGAVTEFVSVTDPYTIGFLQGVSVIQQTEDVYLSVLSDADTAPAILERLCSKNKCNMIITAGTNISSEIKDAALRHPDVQFVTIDGGFTEETIPKNVADIQFRSEESSYIAGYLAGKLTKTNVIGFIGGTNTPPIDRFYYGFKAGVDAAARERGVNIQVLRETIGTYNDMNLGEKAANKMYTEDNCDIIFAVAGSSGTGAIHAAASLGKYIIGVDIDQNYLSPEFVAFSVVKNLPDVSIDIMRRYAKGEVFGGQIIPVGYSESTDGYFSVDVVGYISAVPEDLIEDAEVLKASIAAGKITVPYDKATYEALG